MTGTKKRGGGRPKGSRTPAYNQALAFKEISQVLNSDNKYKATRRAIDIICAFNDVAFELGFEKLPDQGLINEGDRTGTRHMSPIAATVKTKGKREFFAVAGDDSLVDYLARQGPTLSSEFPEK